MKITTKKPVIIGAMLWLGEGSFDELYIFADADNNYGIVGMKYGRGDIAQIRTPKGIIDIKPGDYIVKTTNMELYSLDYLY